MPYEVLKDLLESSKYLALTLLPRPKRSKVYLQLPNPLVVTRSATHLTPDLLQDFHEGQALLRPGDKQGVKETNLPSAAFVKR